MPTDAFLRGDFSLLLRPNQFYGTPRYIGTRSGPGLAAPPIRPPASPTTSFLRPVEPAGLALLNAYPRAIPGVNLSGNNWVLSPQRLDNQRKDTGAVDYIPVDTHYIRFRVQNYSLYHRTRTAEAPTAPRRTIRPSEPDSLAQLHLDRVSRTK